MEVVEHAKRKLSSVIELVEYLQAGDFPHEHAQYVLLHINSLLSGRLKALEQLHPEANRDVVNVFSKEILNKIFEILPLLGFLIRSTNVRNSFELHGPFLRLVKRSLGANAKLIISAEWEFSPFTYEMPDDLGLNDVVFIGIPASESGNGLAIPLAGHEFGHNLWRHNNYFDRYSDIVESQIVKYISEDVWDDFVERFPDVGEKTNLTDMVGKQYWQHPWLWAMCQCEEVFCDFIGLLIFREAYLHAFAYLLAPGLPGTRLETYPNMLDRIKAMEMLATDQNIKIPAGYAELFENSEPPESKEDKFLLSISDGVLNHLLEQLKDDAVSRVREDALDEYSAVESEEVLRYFSFGVPAINRASLSSIVNAAWSFSNDGMVEWQTRYKKISEDHKRRDNMLGDLIYKSIEVLEICEIQGGA